MKALRVMNFRQISMHHRQQPIIFKMKPTVWLPRERFATWFWMYLR